MPRSRWVLSSRNWSRFASDRGQGSSESPETLRGWNLSVPPPRCIRDGLSSACDPELHASRPAVGIAVSPLRREIERDRADTHRESATERPVLGAEASGTAEFNERQRLNAGAECYLGGIGINFR